MTRQPSRPPPPEFRSSVHVGPSRYRPDPALPPPPRSCTSCHVVRSPAFPGGHALHGVRRLLCFLLETTALNSGLPAASSHSEAPRVQHGTGRGASRSGGVGTGLSVCQGPGFRVQTPRLSSASWSLPFSKVRSPAGGGPAQCIPPGPNLQAFLPLCPLPPTYTPKLSSDSPGRGCGSRRCAPEPSTRLCPPRKPEGPSGRTSLEQTGFFPTRSSVRPSAEQAWLCTRRGSGRRHAREVASVRATVWVGFSQVPRVHPAFPTRVSGLLHGFQAGAELL